MSEQYVSRIEYEARHAELLAGFSDVRKSVDSLKTEVDKVVGANAAYKIEIRFLYFFLGGVGGLIITVIGHLFGG